MKYLDNAYIFYAEYHNDMINKLIHMLCVWSSYCLWYMDYGIWSRRGKEREGECWLDGGII